MPWLTAAKWIGTAAGVSGAIMIALNVGLVIYGFGLSVIDGDTIEIHGQRIRAIWYRRPRK
jgi:hypothetical protein